MSFSERMYRIFVFDNRYKLIISGLGNTLLIAFCACLLGGIIGSIICYLRMSKNKILNIFARGYIRFFRGIPIVLLLLLMYYIVFKNTRLSGVIVAIVTFSLYHSAYIAEIFRSGITSVKTEQIEASISIGFTKMQSFFYIILPQLVRVIFPVYKGEFITLIKLTSIVGYIGVRDLTRALDIIRSQTFDALYPLIIATILYFIIIEVMTFILNLLEKVINPRKV